MFLALSIQNVLEDIFRFYFIPKRFHITTEDWFEIILDKGFREMILKAVVGRRFASLGRIAVFNCSRAEGDARQLARVGVLFKDCQKKGQSPPR